MTWPLSRERVLALGTSTTKPEDGHQALDSVGASERASQWAGQTKADDGEHFVQAFVDRSPARPAPILDGASNLLGPTVLSYANHIQCDASRETDKRRETDGGGGCRVGRRAALFRRRHVADDDGLIGTSFSVVQRTCRVRLVGNIAPWFVVLGYNLFILIAGTGCLLGITHRRSMLSPNGTPICG